MMFDHKTDTTKFKVVFHALLILGVITGNSFYKSKMESKELYVIATGEYSSESYKIMEAVAQIVNGEDFDFRLKVVKTQGSIENAKLLDQKLV